ncbi:VOC family protein [Streptococcus pneumoniae]
MKVNVYLRFNGRALEAMTFYTKVFETDFVGPVLVDPDTNHLINACLDLGGLLMSASDVDEKVSNRFSSISLVAAFDSQEKAKSIFSQLAEDGEVILPFSLQDWGDECGHVIDRFGISWDILVPGEMNY